MDMMASISHQSPRVQYRHQDALPVYPNTGDNLNTDLHPSFPQSDTPSASASSEPTPLPLTSSPASTTATVHYDISTAFASRKSSLDTARPRGNSTTSQSSVKRKPLPSSASPLAVRYSSGSVTSPINTTINPPFSRSKSGDSPTLYDNPLTPLDFGFPSQPPLPDDFRQKQREFSDVNETLALTSSHTSSTHQTEALASPNLEIPGQARSFQSSTPFSPAFKQHARLVSDSGLSAASHSTGTWFEDNTSSIRSPSVTMSLFSSKQPPKLTLPINAPAYFEETPTNSKSNTASINKALPKSPGASKLGSFFGWGGNTSPDSSTTTFSAQERAYSPLPSPSSPQSSFARAVSTSSGRHIPVGIDIPKANANEEGYFSDSYLQIPPATPESTTHVDEMEDELKIITAELATSIRREMELEDLVERMQSEAQTSQAGRRTSDYFSDSGTSSTKYGSEHDARTDELDKLQRKTERDKAQIRLELTEKVNEERSRRKVLETQIRSLEEKASQFDLHSMNSVDTNDRLRELESSCEDLRRRLTEERQVKENFEDLLTALKSELEYSHNERDNLRDEIVPQLRARVEGLEAQASEHEKLTYENTKMQQEMQTLKNENATLVNARRAQIDMQQQMSRFNSIAEDSAPAAPSMSSGLSRSNTVTGIRTSASSRPSSLSRARSTSVKSGESRDVLVERVKDIEAQRDALHRALKSLLERQEHQNRAHDARIQQLEMERDRALTSSPKRLGYDREVTNLRGEMNSLRRRADEAIEQKWQCEKGLGGLKMDLQRAEQEIASLRGMVADSSSKVSEQHVRKNSETSDSLERAYAELKTQYASSLERIKALEPNADANTEAALKELEACLTKAISERDFAASEADNLRQANETLHVSEKSYLESEKALADELRASAKGVEDLAVQVRQQLTLNATLRKRLAETIDRGEKEQKSNAARIVFMQGKLKSLEDELVQAQQNSEERIASHEEEIRTLKEAHNSQLSRVRDGYKSPRVFSPKTPLSPMFASMPGRTPKLGKTTSGLGISISEESKVDFLKKRVEELEKALEESDKEMEEVVGRMNSAQIEVMELWNEREEAVRVTRKLQREIEEEQKRGFGGRLNMLQK